MKKAGTMFIKNLRYLCLVGVIVLGLMTIVGTGGGGGGGGSTPITYTGLETQATITDGNAEDLLTGAYEGGSIGTEFDINAIQSGESAHIGRPVALKVSRILEDSLRKVDFASGSGGTFIGGFYTVTGGEDGNCGGDFDFEISVDETTGDFNGSFTFNDYCDDGDTIDGGVSFTGQVDVNSPDNDLLKFTFSFNSLSFASGSDSFTLNGSIAWDVTGSPATITVTLLLRDNSANKVYWVQDYTLTLTEGTDYVEIDVSGRFYHPDYGYVDITTPTPFRINDVDDYPSQGVLDVEGENGTAGGPTRARLIVIDNTKYRVEADTDGDGSYDYVSADLDW